MKRAFVAAVVFCALCAQPALAAPGLGPGVHIDPGSPAAKEYRIPITSARNEASGNSSGSPQSTAAPTFGVGVTPVSSPETAVTAHHRLARPVRHRDGSRGQVDRRRGRHRADAASHSGNTASRAANAASHAAYRVSESADATDWRRATVAAEAEAGSSSWLPLAAGGALVLLVGCGVGLALRRVG